MSQRDVTITFTISSQEQQKIEALAQRRGFENVEDYLMSLVIEDEAEDDDEFDPVELFKQGWHEAMTDQTISLEEMWAMLETDDNE